MNSTITCKITFKLGHNQHSLKKLQLQLLEDKYGADHKVLPTWGSPASRNCKKPLRENLFEKCEKKLKLYQQTTPGTNSLCQIFYSNQNKSLFFRLPVISLSSLSCLCVSLRICSWHFDKSFFNLSTVEWSRWFLAIPSRSFLSLAFNSFISLSRFSEWMPSPFEEVSWNEKKRWYRTTKSPQSLYEYSRNPKVKNLRVDQNSPTATKLRNKKAKALNAKPLQVIEKIAEKVKQKID